jgi:hypothetical protein
MSDPTLTWSSGSAKVIPVVLEQSVTAKNTCSNVQALSKQSASASSFLTNYKLSSDSSDSNMLKRLQEFRASLEKVPAEQRANMQITTEVGVKDYLNTVQSNVTYLRFVDECLKSSNNYDGLQEQRDKTEESKLRYESLKTPEERVSYYEGWFPLFRPISETGLFALFGIALLALFYSAALFLRMGGISLDITLPGVVAGDSYGFSFLEGYGPIVVGFVLGLIAATFYYFTR